MNRYDTISTSAYAPRSLQETLLVPSMRRAQHDAADKNLQTQLSELDKVNPLDKHYGEAQRIKSELSKTIGLQAEGLATQGFSNNTTSDIYRTNRTIGDLYSPTGALGQINAAKLAYDKDSDEYLKSATVLGHSPEVVQRNLKEIQDKYNSGSVYDKNGKISSMSIDQLPPKYVDHIARASDIFAKAGLSGAEIDNLASRIKSTADGTYVLTTGGKRGSSSNTVQMEAAVKFLNDEIRNPNSDVGKSLKYGFKTTEEALNDIKNLSPIFKKNNVSISNSSQISNFTPTKVETPDPDATQPTGIFDPESTKVIGGDVKRFDLSKIGTNKVSFSNALANSKTGLTGRNTPYKAGDMDDKTYTYKDIITDPLNQKAYEVAFKRLKANNKLPKDANINSAESGAKIQFYMNKYMTIPTIGNDIIRPQVGTNSQMFMGQLSGKETSEINATSLADVQSGLRRVIDPSTGKPLDPKEWKVGGKAEKWSISYTGYDSPVAYRGYGFANKEQDVLTHQVVLKDENGAVVGRSVMERTPQELKSPEFKKAYEINHVYRNAVDKFGDWVTATGSYSSSKELKGTKVRFNQDGTLQIMTSKGQLSRPLTPSEYSQTLDDIMSGYSQ